MSIAQVALVSIAVSAIALNILTLMQLPLSRKGAALILACCILAPVLITVGYALSLR